MNHERYLFTGRFAGLGNRESLSGCPGKPLSSRLIALFSMLLLTNVSQGQIQPGVGSERPRNLLDNPGFEILKPAFWEPAGAGAQWTNNTSRTPDWSLSLSGSGQAQWQQEEAILDWIPGLPVVGNPQIEVGAWVKLEGVNTDPASDEERFQLVFEFFEGPKRTSHLLDGPVVLDLPQDRISTGWVEIVSAPLKFTGEQAGKSARVTFRKGERTSGTAFVDDLFIRNTSPRATGWAGEFFNANMDAGEAWGYWWKDFHMGKAGWPASQPHFVTVSDTDAHTGDYSFRLEANGGNAFEATGNSARIPIDQTKLHLVSFWVKHVANAKGASFGTGLNTLGLSVLWYENLIGGAAGFGMIGGTDILLESHVDDPLIPHLGEAGEWTHYAFVVYPSPGARAMQIRLRYWHEFEGVTYWDDLFVAPVADVVSASSGLRNASDPRD